MRILIIEDEDRLRHMMRLTLETDHQIGEAASGEAGLEQFGSGASWDVVLLDQRLPGIDGLETLRRLKKRDSRVCVVMITAFASIELAVDAMKLGATDFLRKPVAPESLRGAVAAAFHLKAERRAAPAATQPFGQPSIVHLTMNGFQIVREREGEDGSPLSRNDHQFTVVQFATGERHRVTVHIDPAAIERVERLTRRNLSGGGAFWREQAERFLASFLWAEGRVPDRDEVVLTEVSRDTIELAAAWQSD
jgi:DNA-binding response OmpR family regulator